MVFELGRAQAGLDLVARSSGAGGVALLARGADEVARLGGGFSTAFAGLREVVEGVAAARVVFFDGDAGEEAVDGFAEGVALVAVASALVEEAEERREWAESDGDRLGFVAGERGGCGVYGRGGPILKLL